MKVHPFIFFARQVMGIHGLPEGWKQGASMNLFVPEGIVKDLWYVRREDLFGCSVSSSV